MRRTLVMAVAVACAGLPGTAIAAGPNVQRPAPTLLMFHAGGFIIGDPSLLDEAAIYARNVGFRTIQVDYTLGDSVQALADAKSAARSASAHRRVFAYGESAGGTLACRLAELGQVAAAGCMSPVADMELWARQFDPEPRHEFLGGRRAQRAVGLRWHPLRKPVVVEVAEDDERAIAAGIRRWARDEPEVRPKTVPGDHLGADGSYGSNMRRLIDALYGKVPNR